MTDRAETEGFIPFGEWQTWYRIVGDVAAAVPLVCLHGGPGSSHHYFARLEALADRGRPVVLYDQVGCGASSRPPADQLDTSVFVAELADLRAQLDLDQVFLLGTSWGGMLAMEYALTQPAGLRGLVLNSTLASAATWAAEQARLRDELPEEHAAALRTNEVDDPRYQEAEKLFNARHFCRREDNPVEIQMVESARGRDVYRAMWGPNEWTMNGKLSGWDVRDRLGEIQIPVLLTAGRHDMCTPSVLSELQEGFPAARTVVFEESSHTPYLEEPGAFMTTIASFLDSVGERQEAARPGEVDGP